MPWSSLVAWKLALHGTPSTGKIRVHVNRQYAYFTRFRPGSYVMLPRVAGHRDADTTDCPGERLLPRLPSIRPRITQLEGDPAVLRMVASAPKVAPGTQVTLSGTLTTMSSGAPIAADPAVAADARKRSGDDDRDRHDGADGSWSAIVPVTLNTVLRALHAVAPAAASNVIEVGVVPQVTLALASAPGAPVRVSGTVAPARRRLTLDIYRLAGGKRHLVRIPADRGPRRAVLVRAEAATQPRQLRPDRPRAGQRSNARRRLAATGAQRLSA